MPKRYHNSPPKGDSFPANAPADAARAEFGRRIQHYLADKAWNQSDLAREATKHMPGKQEFRRDNISNYVRGRQVPGPVRLKALCTALGVKQSDLLPPGAVMSVDHEVPPLEMRNVGDGNVYLRINQIVAQDLAMRIVGMLSREGT